MALSTYSELQAGIADWLNRDDLTAQIPDFIALAEARMNRDVNHWRREKRATATADGQYTALPEDFYRPIRMHLEGKHSALEPISWQHMADARRARDNATGEPKYYAMTAGDIELLPSPTESSSYTLEMFYVRTIPALSDANTTNWLLTEAPDAYLYGALLHTAPFLKDDARVPVWSGLYSAAVVELDAASERAKRGGGKLKLRAAQ